MLALVLLLSKAMLSYVLHQLSPARPHGWCSVYFYVLVAREKREETDLRLSLSRLTYGGLGWRGGRADSFTRRLSIPVWCI